MQSKRRRIDGVESADSFSNRMLDANEYIHLILTSLGYEDVSDGIKKELVSFVLSWIEQVTKQVSVDDKEIFPYNYLHQVYPTHWDVFKRYSLSKKKSPKVSVSKDNMIEDDSSDNYMEFTEETQPTKSNCTISKNSIVKEHFEFLNKRSLLLDVNVYTSSRLCLSSLSSSPSVLTTSIGKPPSNVICQFANLVLFYSLCSCISKVSQLYNINEDELRSTLQSCLSIDTSHVDLHNLLVEQYQSSTKTKRRKRSEKIEKNTLDEYEFIQSML